MTLNEPGIYRYMFGLQLQQPLDIKTLNFTFTMAAAVQQQQRGSKTTTRTMNGSNSKTNSNNRRRGTSLLSDSGKLLLLDLKGGNNNSNHASSGNSGSNGNNNVAPILPTYNNKLVQSCLQDLHGTIRELELKVQLNKENNDDNNNDNDKDDDDDKEKDAGGNSKNKNKSKNKPGMSDRPSILLHDKTIRRHKQCLLAYHHHRMEIMKQIQRTKMAANTTTTSTDNSNNNATAAMDDNNCGGGDGSNSSISTNAQEVEFARNYLALRQQYSRRVFELDVLPPMAHMVQVRVLYDLGQVVLPDSGRAVSMTKGSCLFVDRSDVVDFLRQGFVQLYNTDGEEY